MHPLICGHEYGNAINPVTCGGLMLMLMAVGVLMATVNGAGNGHSPLPCGNANGNGNTHDNGYGILGCRLVHFSLF